MKKGYARLLDLPGEGGAPLNERIAGHLRRLILEGALPAGAKLPAQRVMARDLRVSRNTIISALERLTSEGLVETRLGSGAYVANDPAPFAPRPRTDWPKPTAAPDALPLDVCFPGLNLFPMETWNKLQARRWRRMPRSALDEGDPAGWFDLRASIAARAAATRGLKCSPEQVFIVPSAQVAVELAARALAKPGDVAWMEDPGYWRARDALRCAGLRISPVPVDDQGFDVARARRISQARLAFVTPINQFPTTAILSDERRAALIAWSRSESGWILEDEFDSEFCFEGRAPPPLAAAPGAERVIHIATFNNILFPSLKLAYLIAPGAVVDQFAAARTASDRSTNTPVQMVLHDFIEEGHLAAHVRRCRQVFGERRQTLIEALRERLNGDMEIRAPRLGLHVTAWLAPGESDARLKQAAAERGMTTPAVSTYAVLPTRPGLFLGFAGYRAQQIRRAVERLAAVREDMRGPLRANA